MMTREEADLRGIGLYRDALVALPYCLIFWLTVIDLVAYLT